MRTLASLDCCAAQSVVTSTSATAMPRFLVEAQHHIWTPLAPHPFRERVVGAGRPLVPPLYIRVRNRLQVLQFDGASHNLAVFGDDVPNPLPDEQELPVALAEQLLIHHAGRH